MCDRYRMTLSLRFLLAWLYFECGADPKKKWLFTSFWKNATGSGTGQDNKDMLDGYEQSSGAQTALNGICRELGWERTAGFEHEMKARRTRR